MSIVLFEISTQLKLSKFLPCWLATLDKTWFERASPFRSKVNVWITSKKQQQQKKRKDKGYSAIPLAVKKKKKKREREREMSAQAIQMLTKLQCCVMMFNKWGCFDNIVLHHYAPHFVVMQHEYKKSTFPGKQGYQLLMLTPPFTVVVIFTFQVLQHLFQTTHRIYNICTWPSGTHLTAITT